MSEEQSYTASCACAEQEVIDKYFNLVASNAVDFLHKSVDYFENDLKVSVICFCSAFETFIKARLIKTNWKLIFSKPDNATIEQFESGDFRSISISNALRLIHLTKSEKEIFQDLNKHRNKIIHFFHSQIDGDGKNDLIETQFRAHYYLQNFFKYKWHTHFEFFFFRF